MHSEHEGVTRRDLNRVALIVAVLFAAMTSLLFMRLTPAMRMAGSSRWVTFVLVAVFIVAALVCNSRCRRQIVWHNRVMAVWLVVAGACFSICAGATVSTLLESGNPATVAVFCASGIAVADMALMSVCVREPMVRGVVSAVSFVALPLALASAATVLFDLSVQLLAGMVVAASVCGIQMMPNIVVHVPDRYLVEWRTYMTRRWTVRGSIPEEARVLTRKDVRQDMDSFLAQYSTGFTLCVVLSVLGYAALAQWTDYHSLYDRIGFLVLSMLLMLFFELKPRQSGRPFEQYVMRAAGIAIPLLWVGHATQAIPEGEAMIPLICMVTFAALGLVLGFSMVVQHNGFHSLALSRIGDALCFISMMLIPAASFLAGGALEFLRSMSW